MNADMDSSENPQGETVQIRVKGSLDTSWSDWFGGLNIFEQPDGNTLLTGQVSDQAALQGILSKLYAMNLGLISLKVDHEAFNH